MQNPFLDSIGLPNWNKLKPEHIVPDLTRALEQADEQIAGICEIPLADCTFDNVLIALEKAEETLSYPWSKVSTLDSLMNTPEVREAYRKMLPKVTQFFAKIPFNQALWERIDKVTQTAVLSDPVDQRLLDETRKSFIEAGANLPQEQKDQLLKIEEALADKTQQFSENVLDATNAFEWVTDDPSQLSGLPESYKESARQNALQKGLGTEKEPKYRFTLQFPSFAPALRYLDSDSIRKLLFEAHTQVGRKEPHDNSQLIIDILKLRQDKAHILGKLTFADLTLKNRMARNPQKAIAFIEDLHAKTKPFFKEECDQLESFKAEKNKSNPSPLYPWESAYWNEKLRQQEYDFNEEEVRPYFPIGSVQKGLFQIAEKLFGIKVKELQENKPPVWHDSVDVYEVFDTKTNKRLGVFYTDWFPRETKRSGAWMSPFHSAWLSNDSDFNIGMICGNFNTPSKDAPALLTHREVETLFHEFGHLIHHLLSEVKYPSLGGTQVAWDFVELPSQIMENWCWEKESLDLFAKHYQTGETIPDSLFKKMLSARNFSSARLQMRQLNFAITDLKLHTSNEELSTETLDSWIERITHDYNPACPIPYPNQIRSFSHLFSSPTGYAAGYYSYKWAEVLDADCFESFKTNGILDSQTGLKFRETILSQGNARPAEELFIAFKGRPPQPDALLKRLGLT